MRFLPLVVSAFFLFTDTLAIADPRGSTSWGKAGVSLSQFALDANDCSETSRTVAVAIKPETLRALDVLSTGALLDIAMQAAPSPTFNPMSMVETLSSQKSAEDIARRTNTFGGKYVAMVRPDVKDELQEVLDKCLMERGYVRIILNADQQKRLSKLKNHTAERTAYLHSIDSDPVIIERQRSGSAN
jgi:hypothetical protein